MIYFEIEYSIVCMVSSRKNCFLNIIALFDDDDDDDDDDTAFIKMEKKNIL